MNTPSTWKVDDLFGSVRYTADWSIRSQSGAVVMTHERARETLNGYVKVRHAIAHGGLVERKAASVVRLVAVGGDPHPNLEDLTELLTLLKDLTRMLAEGEAVRFRPPGASPDAGSAPSA